MSADAEHLHSPAKKNIDDSRNRLQYILLRREALECMKLWLRAGHHVRISEAHEAARVIWERGRSKVYLCSDGERRQEAKH